MVPEGWSRLTLDDAANYRRGSFPQPYGLPEWYDGEGALPFVQVYDVDKNQRLKPKTKQMISVAAMDKSVFVPSGTILVTLQGSIGRVAISQFDAYVDRTLLIFTGFKAPTDVQFFACKIEELFAIEKDKAPGGTIKTITKAALSRFKINLPPLPEQRKIADILSTWDRAIEKTESLLANARTQKRALMQSLLTGKRRFPEFEGQPWKEVRLGDVASISMGSSPKSAAYNDDGIGLPLVQGNADVKNGRTVPRTYTSEITTRCQPGDILMSVRAPVGSIAISDHEACVGRGAAVFRPKGQCDWQWLKHLMLWLEPQWARISQGSTFEAVNSKDLKAFVVPVPATYEEAKQIGSAIEVAHLECDALSGQITKLRTEKKALMQQLLTGKRRVIA